MQKEVQAPNPTDRSVLETATFVLRRHPAYSIGDFLVEVPRIIRQEIKPYVSKNDVFFNREDLMSEGYSVAVFSYGMAAHIKCPSISKMCAYFRISLRRHLHDMMSHRVRRDNLEDGSRALCVSFQYQNEDGEEVEWVPSEEFKWATYTMRKIDQDLEESNDFLARVIFAFYVGNFGLEGIVNLDETQRKEVYEENAIFWSSCILGNSEATIDSKRFASYWPGRVSAAEIGFAIRRVRRAVYEQLPTTAGSIEWEKSLLYEQSLSRRELPLQGNRRMSTKKTKPSNWNTMIQKLVVLGKQRDQKVSESKKRS